MTTTVTVTTHSWPVEVQRINPTIDPPEPILGAERIEPNSQVQFVMHDAQALVMRELPLPSKVL